MENNALNPKFWLLSNKSFLQFACMQGNSHCFHKMTTETMMSQFLTQTMEMTHGFSMEETK
jgi:hypothetical protein